MYTGNTIDSSFPIFFRSVYPCVYREHGIRCVFLLLFGGLSLCIQGTLNYKTLSIISKRFIPVYTGNTGFYFIGVKISPVYPCVYREHFDLAIYGSVTVRFIPVYTGNTNNEPYIGKKTTVYPCVYREHRKKIKENKLKSGLSLCIQGTRSIQQSP